MIKKMILLLFLSGSMLKGENVFNFDITRYFWNDKISEVEVDYSIPYDLLSYSKEGDELTAPFRIDVCFENLITQESIYDTLRKRSIIPSRAEAEKRNLLVLEQFRVFFKQGKYKLTMDLVDDNTGRKYTKSEIFNIDTLGSQLTISDIKLSTSIEKDTTDGRFVRNNLKIVPNPSAFFGIGREMLYFYAEVYNLNRDSVPYELTYMVLESEDTIINVGPKKKEKSDTVDVIVGGFNLVALKPGFYTLRIEVMDNGNYTLSEDNFRIQEKATEEKKGEKELFTEEEKKYYDKIEYIASQKELSYFRNLSESGRKEFLKRFWLKRDSNPDTEKNEGLEEFIRRLKYVDNKYSTPFKKGYNTDRGRIYIKYGDPDGIERHLFDVGNKPYEVWEYYSYGGYRFIFADMGGDGEFTLIYSSTPKETTLPNWSKYVPEEAGTMQGE
jgi:GWxTD domain-containing protein